MSTSWPLPHPQVSVYRDGSLRRHPVSGVLVRTLLEGVKQVQHTLLSTLSLHAYWSRLPHVWPSLPGLTNILFLELQRSYLTVTASQAQHYLVSTLFNSTNSYSTLLDFNNSCIQHYSNLHSTHLAFNKSCIQHYLISTIMDSTILVLNNNGFNNRCFQHTLDSIFIFFYKMKYSSQQQCRTIWSCWHKALLSRIEGGFQWKEILDRPAGPIVAASGKGGCKL